MSEKPDHSNLGDPYDAASVGKPDRPTPARPDTPNDEVGDPVRRPGDSGLGDPEPAADVIRTVPKEETNRHQKQLELEQQRLFEQKLAELADQGGSLRLPRPLRKAVASLLIVIAAILGLLLVSNAVGVAKDLSSLPPYARWLAAGGAILFGGVLAVVLVQILWLVLRLGRSPRINVKALQVLHERHQLQRLAATHQAAAKAELEQYLRAFPIENAKTRALQAAGVTDAELEHLGNCRKRLLDTARPITAADWLDDFSGGFQATLDKAAGRCVRRYAQRGAAGTAISPISFVDQMIVLYCCTAMVKDLLCIYQLRPAFGQTAALVARTIIHTYLSGSLEEATEAATDAATEWAGDGVGLLGAAFFSRLGAKAAEASVNGLLLWRLGRRAIPLLQPCVATPKPRG
jgi:uncharacterized membrane protein YcjF (UPF0283 family)